MTETDISAILQMKLFSTRYVFCLFEKNLLIALMLLKSFWENEDFYAEFNSFGLKKRQKIAVSAVYLVFYS